MSLRTMLPVLGLSVFLSGSLAQTTEPPAKPEQPKTEQPKAGQPKPDAAKPAAREMPPDIKAFNEANSVKDLDKRIEALAKWKHDFPDSTLRSAADSGVLSAMMHKKPVEPQSVRAYAAGMYRSAEAKNRGSVANTIAGQMLDNNLLLKDAERYATKSVDSMRLATYLDEQITAAQKRKREPPSPQELEKRFRESRVARVATLGRIEVKLGHTARGQKLLEEVYAITPGNTAVAAALGAVAFQSGDDAKAMEYLIPVRLSGRPDKESQEAFESIYRKMHAGSLDGMDAMLDAEYRKRLPNPLVLDAYKPTGKRSDRVVLAEVFTGSGCPPCVGADLAFDAAMERYSRKDLAVVMYHQHIPRPDPMTNPDTQARAKNYSVNGVPTFAIDGKKTVGGGSRETTKEVYGRFDKDLEKDLETPAEAHVAAEASLAGNTVHVHASVDHVNSDSESLKLQILLVEKELHYAGENGIRFHPMVVRAMGGEKGAGFDLDEDAKAYDQTFDLDAVSKALKAHLDEYEAKGHRGETFTFLEKKDRINRANLAVVVFVQDDESKHVLQASYIDLGQETTRPVTDANGSR